jgi:hypothetical protein
MHKVRYRSLPSGPATLDPVMIRAVPTRRLICAYVDPALLDPLLVPTLEAIGEDAASVYDWRSDGPVQEPIVNLRVHLVPQVPGSQFAFAELEPGAIHLSIDQDLIRADLASALAVHATQMMRLMR